jgi:hypothetical protein
MLPNRVILRLSDYFHIQMITNQNDLCMASANGEAKKGKLGLGSSMKCATHGLHVIYFNEWYVQTE